MLDSKSKKILATCHPDLVALFTEVAKRFPIVVLEGARSKKRQEHLFRTGASKTMNSKHIPVLGLSGAVDVAPAPLDWKDIPRFYYLGGYVMRTAQELEIDARQGHDWDGDTETDDQEFNDLDHYELKK